MILLDTNVVSELMRDAPDPAVDAWFAANEQDTAIPAPVIGEIAFGIAKLPAGAKRRALESRLSEWRVRYADRSIPFTAATAMLYGAVMAGALSAKHNMAVIDGQIAAMAIEQDAVLATRNVKDFKTASAKVVNPWD